MHPALRSRTDRYCRRCTDRIGPGTILYIVVYAVCHSGSHIQAIIYAVTSGSPPARKQSHWFRVWHSASGNPSEAVCFSDLELLGAIITTLNHEMSGSLTVGPLLS